MTLISLGGGCCVKHHIDLFLEHTYETQPTHFFDWLLTDFNSACEILRLHNDIDTLLNRENFRIDVSKPYNASVQLILLSHCESIHDVPNPYNEKDIDDFIDKYKRRLERLISLIQSNEHIYFIRFDYGVRQLTEEQKRRFHDLIHDINPTCKYTLVSLLETNKNIYQPNYIGIDLNAYKFSKDKTDWKNNHYNWDKIFRQILP